MFVRRLVQSAVAFSFVVAATAVHAAPVTYTLDTQKSSIKWLAQKVVGKHNGNVKLSEGSLVMEGVEPKSGTFTIDFNTIADEDIPAGENRQKLETHLKSSDFFDVPKFPTGTFKITGVRPAKDKSNFTVVGDLTVKGRTKSVSIPAVVVVNGKEAKATANFKINRLDYDIKYNSKEFFDAKKLGDKVILNDIELTLDLVATAK